MKNGVFDVPMSEESGDELYQHWVDQAFSSLMAAMATERLPTLPKKDREKHFKCAKDADDVQAHAKCVSALLEDGAEEAKRIRWMKLLGKRRVKNRVLHLKPSVAKNLNKKKVTKKRRLKRKKILLPKRKKSVWSEGFQVIRRKREVVQRSSYELIDKRHRSPFGQIARQLTKTVRRLKKKKHHKNWQKVISEIKTLTDEERERREAEERLKKSLKFYKTAAVVFDKGRKSKARTKGTLSKLHDLENVLKYERYDDVRRLKKELAGRRKLASPDQRAITEPLKLVRQGAKLAMMMAGQNASKFDEKSLRVISPRILSLVPESDTGGSDEVNMFSPSLFSLHNTGQGLEKTLSLPSLLGSSGLLSTGDQQDWMDFVIETSGADEIIEKAKKKKEVSVAKNDINRVRGPDGQPVYLTKQNVTKLYGEHEASKIETFERLQKSFTSEQFRQMNRTGYAILSLPQRELMYGSESPFNNTAVLDVMRNVTDGVVHRTVRDTIRGVAEGQLKFQSHRGEVKLVATPQRRHKRAIVLSPISNGIFINDPVSVSQPIILSPVMLSALINSPAIFGVVVLSPWLFIPVVLSPRIFSPVVLSPFAFVPIILTPLAFVPIILSPGVMNPFVLTPFIFSPFILSPQALTPLILSPFALSPLIGTPNVLSPLVLSPFVLSPLIFSPAYVSALVLSPYALSPAINSTGVIFTAVASPSFLS
ncbi:unnamed protein product [Nippostrongylus brasiliensis]|uniref:WW domain-containing protein n=1 Tax=Nippostrongylus brasiliensis TaxID=27835 RepID=A0A0N4Y456_NIPBR|nr:unnamed protein product [Nippostrongylus brasiliensis]